MAAWLEHPGARPWIAWALFAASSALRLWFNLVIHPPGRFIESDMWVYDLRAKNLLAGTLGVWDTFTPVGYPALLAGWYALGGGDLTWVAVAQALLGGGVVALTFLVGVRLTGSAVVSLAASLLVAAHLPLVLYGGFLLSEVPFSFFLLLSVWLVLWSAERRGWLAPVVAGVALGAAVAIRPNLLVALPLLLGWGAYVQGRRGLLRAAGVVAAAALVLVPVALHNSRLAGRPMGLASNGGLNFYLSFADVRGVEVREGGQTHRIVPIPNLLHHRHIEVVDAPFWDEAIYYRKGLALLGPSAIPRALRNGVEGLGLGGQDYWPGWEGRGRLLRTYSRAFFFWGILPACAWPFLFRWRGRDREGAAIWVGGVAATSLLTMVLFLGDPRIRVPFDPLWILLSLACLDRLLAALTKRRAGPSRAASGRSGGADAEGGGDGPGGDQIPCLRP